MAELELRVQQLEAELSRMRGLTSYRPLWIGGGISLVCVAVVAALGLGGRNRVGADEPKASRAITVFQTPFEVQDKDKKTVVRIEDEPTPALWLFGKKGESVKLVIADTGGAVSIRSSSGQSPSFIGYDSNGNGKLQLNDKGGVPVADLTNFGSQVYVSGRAVAHFGISSKGEGMFMLGNGNGDALVDAGVLEGRGIVRAYPYSPRTGEILRGSNFIIGAKK